MVMSKERVLSRWRYVGVLIGTAGLIVACGGSTGGASGGGRGTLSADAFITETCKLFEPCCAAANQRYDEARCRQVLTVFTLNANYNSIKAEECLSAMRAAANGPTFCDDGPSEEGARRSCEEVFTPKPDTKQPGGTKKPGELCDSDTECAASPEGVPRCDVSFSGDQAIRRCQLLVKGKEGDDCVGDMIDASGRANTWHFSEGPPPERVTVCYVPDRIYCHGTTNKCTKTQDIGGPCDAFNPNACVATAYCDQTAQTCAARKGAGEECRGYDLKECAEKHYCDLETKKCTLKLPAGQPCTKHEQCANGQCVNGKCDRGEGYAPFACAP